MAKTDEIYVKDSNGNLQFFSPSGEKVRIKYIWNENRDGLVEQERIDIVKDMNEKAKGMSIPEQIARLDRGDTSVIDNSRVTPEDYQCDVSGMPEHPIEIIDQVVQAKVAAAAMKQQEEFDAKLKELQEQLLAKKAEYDAAMKAVDEIKQSKEGEK